MPSRRPQHGTQHGSQHGSQHATSTPTPPAQLTLDRGIASAPFASGTTPPPPSPPPPPPSPSAAATSRKKAKPPKTKPRQQPSKSSSTPSLRAHIMSDSDLDKKRNKLGYQRISIACAHCRRRKIRCLLSEDESEQRCQNCIRLKKECVFYPVDQQAAIDARSETSTRSAAQPSAPSSAAVSTSPTQMDATSFEQAPHPFGSGFQNVPQESTTAFQSIPIPSNHLPMQAPSQQYYPYQPARPTDQHWQSSEYALHRQRIPTNTTPHLSQPHSRYNTASGADVAPFPSSPNVSQAESFAYPSEQSQQQWQPPPTLRSSMPYSEHYGPPHAQQMAGPDTRTYQQAPGDRAMHTTPGHSHFPVQPHYMMPSDQRSSSVPGMSPYSQPPQQAPQPWYPNGPPHGGYPNSSG
ncbi:hypothetical protein AC579_3571 [Pseudocercospora musae]|uniref:Zn(2)-C6 fungal-type domain-containing protein n=1 Tax=Pseudocercospora musae TaxID=113226 RepID=A0A139IVV7_9PEZI|nr:hypothetical protein AC579_3571 [Pseudocercospora musae]KXT18881.1 hypothetical protein AC579_3571 [Pseudocercospora musae]